MSSKNIAASVSGGSTGGGKQSYKLTLDEILGRARTAIGESRQFRDPFVSKVKGDSNTVQNAKVDDNNITASSPLPDVAAGSNVQLRRPGFPSTSAKSAFSNQRLTGLEFKRIDYDGSDSDSSSHSAVHKTSIHKSSSQHSSSESSSSGSDSSGNESDDSSTITPPTITDTPLSISYKANKADETQNSQSNHNQKKSSTKNINNNNESNNTTRTKDDNALENILLIRGDPVSQESYVVLKEMLSQKEENKNKDKTEKSSSSYTDDWVSNVNSRRNLSESIEIPKTKTETDVVEIPLDLDPTEASLSAKETASSLIIEEIFANLDSLDIISETTITDDEHELFPVDEEDKDDKNNSLPLYKSRRSSSSKTATEADAQSTSTKGKSVSSSVTAHQNTSSKKSIASIITGSSRASLAPTSHSKSLANKAASRHGQISKAVLTTRQSSRKTFQQVLSHVKLETNVQDSHGKRKKEDVYHPPKTKPQSQIQSILEKEVYNKELQRLRSVQKQVEKEERKLIRTKALNAQAARLQQSSKIKYKPPAYTNVLLPELMQDPLMSSPPTATSNLGAPYFNKDGTLGRDYSSENYPRTPDENYSNQVTKMDIPQLVREVMASNERMYNMTVLATKEMAKNYGKNAKTAANEIT